MTDAASSHRAFYLAVAIMIGAAALTAIDTLLVRVISRELNAFGIAFFRSAFGLLFVLPWIFRKRATIFQTNYFWLHAVRAVLKILALVTFFYAVSRANLAQVTAINFTSPIFVTIGAALLLSEKLSMARVAAVALGFAGVVLIVRPTTENFDPFLLFALLGALFTAAIQLVLKSMSGRDPTDTLVAWNLISDGSLRAYPGAVFLDDAEPSHIGAACRAGRAGGDRHDGHHQGHVACRCLGHRAVRFPAPAAGGDGGVIFFRPVRRCGDLDWRGGHFLRRTCCEPQTGTIASAS